MKMTTPELQHFLSALAERRVTCRLADAGAVKVTGWTLLTPEESAILRAHRGAVAAILYATPAAGSTPETGQPTAAGSGHSAAHAPVPGPGIAGGSNPQPPALEIASSDGQTPLGIEPNSLHSCVPEGVKPATGKGASAGVGWPGHGRGHGAESESTPRTIITRAASGLKIVNVMAHETMGAAEQRLARFYFRQHAIQAQRESEAGDVIPVRHPVPGGVTDPHLNEGND